MADKTTKHADNVPGKYYVCDTCSACASCTAFAPNNFKLSDDMTHACVFKQPENEQEEAEAKEAMESCPSSAIGDDGAE
jgi:ferredoxin